MKTETHDDQIFCGLHAARNVPFEPRVEIPIAPIAQVLNQLTCREAEIIVRRFWREETLQKIGEHFGINRERVRQIEAKALRKMRRADSLKILEPSTECVSWQW